jgi:lipopolysaccharide export system permease protein
VSRFSLYLYQNVLPLYVAGLVLLLLLLLAMSLLGVLAQVISRGASPVLVAQFLLYNLPTAAGYGIPLALLFASLLGLTQLAQSGEIKAALLLGVSPLQFAWPVLLLGLGVCAVSFVNNALLVPWSAAKALEVQKDILLQSPQAFLKEGHFFTDALGRSIYIEKLEPGGVAMGITVIQAGGSSGPSEVIQATRGELDRQTGVWRLSQVHFVSYRQGKVVLNAKAESASLPVRQLEAGSGSMDLTQLSIGELERRIHNNGANSSPAERTALQRKFSEPAAAIAFALFALAVALFTFRSKANIGFVAVLFLTFIYYATWSVTKLLGAQGTIPAWSAAWTPVALYALAALLLFSLAWRR